MYSNRTSPSIPRSSSSIGPVNDPNFLLATPRRRVGLQTHSSLHQASSSPTSSSHSSLDPKGIPLHELLQIKALLGVKKRKSPEDNAIRIDTPKSEPSKKLLLSYSQAGKRAVRVLDIRVVRCFKPDFITWVEVQEKSPEQNRRDGIPKCIQLVDKVLEALPQFRRSLLHGDFSHQRLNGMGSAMISLLVDKIHDGCGLGRSDDTSSLRMGILEFMLPNNPTATDYEKLQGLSDRKNTRGFNHPATARLLCPLSLIDQFDADPAGMMLKLSDNFPKEYHEGSLSLFFYDEKLVDKTKGVIENEHAFLRSPILVRCWIRIFFGPTAARESEPAVVGGRPNNAQLALLDGVTPRSIVYAAVQGIHSLSSNEQWSSSSKSSFQYLKLHDNLLAFFEIESFAKPLLAWWNSNVWKRRGHLTGAKNIDDSDDDDDPDTGVENDSRRFLEFLKQRERDRLNGDSNVVPGISQNNNSNSNSNSISISDTVIPNDPGTNNSNSNNIDTSDTVIPDDPVASSSAALQHEDEANTQEPMPPSETAVGSMSRGSDVPTGHADEDELPNASSGDELIDPRLRPSRRPSKRPNLEIGPGPSSTSNMVDARVTRTSSRVTKGQNNTRRS